jgi:hypothetical protein
MKILKIVSVQLVLALTLSLALPIANAANVPDEQFQVPAPAEQQMRGYYVNEMAESTQSTSTYISTWVGERKGWRNNEEAPTDVVVCSSSTAPECDLRIIQQFLSVLPMCENGKALTCIEEIYAEKDGRSLKIETIGRFPVSGPTDFVADESIGLPDGAQPILVRIPDAPHEKGNTYIFRGQLTGFRSTQGAATEKFRYRGFQAGVFAVDLVNQRAPNFQGACGYLLEKLEPGKSFRFDATKKVDTAGCTYDQVSRFGPSDTTRGCVSNSPTQCAAPYPLPQDVNFGMKVRFQYPLTGWLHGRIENPLVSYQSTPSGGSVITMKAQATKVPVFQVWKKYSELSENVKTLLAAKSYARISSWFTGPGGANNEDLATDTQKSITRHGGELFDETEMQNILAWIPYAQDKAAALPTVWAFRTMNPNIQQTNSCLQEAGSLNGVVATNSTQYIDGPPVLNSRTNTLDYKVASPHLTPTGDVFKGSYNLVLKSSVARCLYNFTNAPISASVSIQNESGVSSVATTVVSERNGWLYLSANGFTFSSPVIQVKLTQEAPAPTPTPTPIATQAPAPVESAAPAPTLKPVMAKKIAITCVKGKLVKKVSAVKPKCPAGYKKK